MIEATHLSTVYCRNCNHQLSIHRTYKFPECGWPFNPDDPGSFVSSLPKPKTAVIIELSFGLPQVFGLGHFYAGCKSNGPMFMFGYWVLLIVVVLVGSILDVASPAFVVTWALAALISSISAAREARLPATARR